MINMMYRTPDMIGGRDENNNTNTPGHQDENSPSPGPGLGSTQDGDVLPLRQIG